MEWLDNHGFPPHDLHFLKPGEKHASLRKFTAAIEDDYAQAHSFATIANTPCFVLKHPWNATKPQIPDVIWVPDWRELARRLTSLFVTAVP